MKFPCGSLVPMTYLLMRMEYESNPLVFVRGNIYLSELLCPECLIYETMSTIVQCLCIVSLYLFDILLPLLICSGLYLLWLIFLEVSSIWYKNSHAFLFSVSLFLINWLPPFYFLCVFAIEVYFLETIDNHVLYFNSVR